MGGKFIMNKMDVIILAGGLGTRLRSVVSDLPKCLAPVNDRPFLYYLFQYLKGYNIDRVILSVGYLHEQVQEWVSSARSLFPFEVLYAVEKTPLGTGGGVRLAMSYADTDNVLILNGDTFFYVDLLKMSSSHLSSGKPVTVALKYLENFDRYGSVELDGNGMVAAFHEKHYCDKGFINGGVCMIKREPEMFDGMPDKFSFETMLLEPYAASLRVNGFVDDGYFIDIGIPEDYEKACMDLKDYKF